VPVSQTAATVDLDQVFSMFNAPTRAAVVAQTAGFAAGFAGRGSDINDAFRTFLPLFDDLGPVARNLASPKTDFGGFWHGLERFSGALAPVAQQNADLYVHLDTTFRALAGVAVPFLQDWISQTPPTESAVIASSPTISSFLSDTAALLGELRPGFATLPQSAPVLADAFAAGTANLPATAGLDQRTVALAKSVASYGQMPAVQQGLDRVTLTLSSLRSPLAFLTPVQATCNYITLFLYNNANLLSEPNGNGTSLRFLSVAVDDVLGSEGSPSQKPFTEPNTDPQLAQGPIHVNPYPNTASPGQPHECSAGNEPAYSGAAPLIGNPPGNLGVTTGTVPGHKQ
jgi:phospholipid/cholesterol/gamma-HCH transport system substrate-binding protein